MPSIEIGNSRVNGFCAVRGSSPVRLKGAIPTAAVRLSSYAVLSFAVLVLAASTALGDSWSATGLFSPPVFLHTATRLSNGKVLVTGGFNGTEIVASTTIFDPSTNNWTAAAPMGAKRYGHTATLLGNGKVLVAGGLNESFAHQDSAEIYDPATDQWTPAGTMPTARAVHAASLLPNGKVLVTGGDTPSSYTATCALYDPGLNSWSAAAGMTNSRGLHTSTLLANGKVLVAGGYGAPSPRNAEIYDPATNTWNAAGTLTLARVNHTATLLTNGSVLVAGGQEDSSGALSSVERYDPGTNSWSAATSMSTARQFHTAALLPNGNVLVAGGNTQPDYLAFSSGTLASAEIYDASGDLWGPAASMGTARQLSTATVLANGKVLVAGGNNDGAALDSAEIYSASSATPTSTASTTPTLTATMVSTATPTDTAVPVATPTPSLTPSETPTYSPTGVPTATPSPTAVVASCPSTPLSPCVFASVSTISIQDRGSVDGPRLTWRWLGGPPELADFGLPTLDTDYLVCLYQDGVNVSSARIDAGSGWKASPNVRSFTYRNFGSNEDGVRYLRLKKYRSGASISFSAQGADANLPALPVSEGTTFKIQLIQNPLDGFYCWDSEFAPPSTTNRSKAYRDADCNC